MGQMFSAGASGLVHFDEYGERNTDYSVYDLQKSDDRMKFVSVLNFDSNSKTVKYDKNISCFLVALHTSTSEISTFYYFFHLFICMYLFCRTTPMFSNVIWPTGKIPTDNPECGFDNELCEWLNSGNLST